MKRKMLAVLAAMSLGISGALIAAAPAQAAPWAWQGPYSTSTACNHAKNQWGPGVVAGCSMAWGKWWFKRTV